MILSHPEQDALVKLMKTGEKPAPWLMASLKGKGLLGDDDKLTKEGTHWAIESDYEWWLHFHFQH